MMFVDTAYFNEGAAARDDGTAQPISDRRGNVLIPSAWSVLAWAVLMDDTSSDSARALAREVLKAGEET